MKQFLSIALAVVCVGLVVALYLSKQGADAQHDSDVSAIDGLSNQLASAQSQIASGNGTMLTLSNGLGQSQSATMFFSNQLVDAQSTITLNLEQITNLTQQVAVTKSENQVLGQHIVDAAAQTTAQVAALTNQIALVKTDLAQAHKDYGLLENRLRRDVAERLVVERKFNSPVELQKQMLNLKTNPAAAISEESIYKGLDVEVKSNAFHVISPN